MEDKREQGGQCRRGMATKSAQRAFAYLSQPSWHNLPLRVQRHVKTTARVEDKYDAATSQFTYV